MSKASETTGTSTTNSTSGTGTGTGGGGTQGGPHPKRTLEIVLLFAILILVAYDTYAISQNRALLQNRQITR